MLLDIKRIITKSLIKIRWMSIILMCLMTMKLMIIWLAIVWLVMIIQVVLQSLMKFLPALSLIIRFCGLFLVTQAMEIKLGLMIDRLFSLMLRLIRLRLYVVHNAKLLNQSTKVLNQSVVAKKNVDTYTNYEQSRQPSSFKSESVLSIHSKPMSDLSKEPLSFKPNVDLSKQPKLNSNFSKQPFSSKQNVDLSKENSNDVDLFQHLFNSKTIIELPKQSVSSKKNIDFSEKEFNSKQYVDNGNQSIASKKRKISSDNNNPNLINYQKGIAASMCEFSDLSDITICRKLSRLFNLSSAVTFGCIFNDGSTNFRPACTAQKRLFKSGIESGKIVVPLYIVIYVWNENTGEENQAYLFLFVT